MGRAVTVTLGLIGIMIYGFLSIASDKLDNEPKKEGSGLKTIPVNFVNRDYIPKGDYDELIHHSYYSLDYNEEYEVPNWVAYKLTEESLDIKNVPRQKRFNVDPEVDKRSAKHSDYTHSGYTRGHMAPAGDMAFNTEAMKESFFMSNMTPQLRALNGGIWRELEENVRDWAYDNDEIYVVSGPLYYSGNPQRIGKNKVAVPDAFFKAILDNKGKQKKSIGFLIPHSKSDKHLKEYAVSIDKIEEETGLDLFSEIFDNVRSEEELERSYNVNYWQISRKRFEQRIKHWNREK